MIVCVVLGVAFMSACSAPSKLTREQAEQVEMCKSQLPLSKKIKLQSVTSGCMLSMAFNKMIGSNNPAPMICMAGGGAGLLFGESIAERKCGYMTLENQLDGEIAHAEKMNAGFSIVFAQQALDLKQYEMMASGLAAQKASDEKSLAEKEAFRKQLDEQLAKEWDILKASREEVQFKTETLQKSKALARKEKEEKLQEEIKALRSSIKTLQENTAKLARVKNSLAATSAEG